MDQSDHSVGVDYLSIFHPNNPTLVLGMLVGCVATDSSSSQVFYHLWIQKKNKI